MVIDEPIKDPNRTIPNYWSILASPVVSISEEGHPIHSKSRHALPFVIGKSLQEVEDELKKLKDDYAKPVPFMQGNIEYYVVWYKKIKHLEEDIYRLGLNSHEVSAIEHVCSVIYNSKENWPNLARLCFHYAVGEPQGLPDEENALAFIWNSSIIGSPGFLSLQVDTRM